MTNYKMYPVLLGWVIDGCLVRVLWACEAVFSVQRPRLSEPKGLAANLCHSAQCKQLSVCGFMCVCISVSLCVCV